MEWLWTLLIIAAMAVAAIAGITVFQRGVTRAEGRAGLGALGGALSGLENVFNPEAAQAKLMREEQTRARAPIPSPGDLPPGVRFEADEDGVPTRVTIRPDPAAEPAFPACGNASDSGGHAEPLDGRERRGPAGPAGAER